MYPMIGMLKTIWIQRRILRCVAGVMIELLNSCSRSTSAGSRAMHLQPPKHIADFCRLGHAIIYRHFNCTKSRVEGCKSIVFKSWNHVKMNMEDILPTRRLIVLAY